MTKKKAVPKLPSGRPSSYKPEYCAMLIKHMKRGLSFESFSAVIGVCRDTLFAWSSETNNSFIPAFSDAKKKAFAENLLFWEKLGIDGLWGSKDCSFNSTVWIFNMKNRHRWRDRQEIELDANVTTNPLKEEMKKKSTEDLLKIIKTAKADE